MNIEFNAQFESSHPFTPFIGVCGLLDYTHWENQHGKGHTLILNLIWFQVSLQFSVDYEYIEPIDPEDEFLDLGELDTDYVE